MSHSKKIHKAFNEWISEQKIDNIEFEDIDFSDYPDFCDAYICYAECNGEPMTSQELNALNEDRDFVYEKLMDHLL